MLDLFTQIVSYDKLHPKFKIFKECLFLTGEQNILNDWIDGFIDRDNKIVKEFQTTFHSAFWEFYLFSVFKEAGFEIDFNHNRPDFIIKAPQKMYIEAVVSNIKSTGSQEENRTLDDILSMVEPINLQQNFDYNIREAITRYSNSIQSKDKKYEDYTNDNKLKFDKEAPYVIALSGYEQINYGKNFYYPMMALLYGLYYDNINDKYTKRNSIIKPDTENKDIPIGLFLDDSKSHISAIIFSCTVTLGKVTSLAISQNKSKLKTNSVLCIRHDTEPPYFKTQIVSPSSPEYLSDGLFIFHNPFAKNALNKELFEKTNAVHISLDIENDRKIFEGNNLPIVSRLNLFAGETFLRNSIFKIYENLNFDLVFVFAKVLNVDSYEKNNHEVEFLDLDDNIEFTIGFTTERFEEYQIEKDKKFIFIFNLNNDKEKLIPKTSEQLELFKKMNKIKCLSLDGGHIIKIEPMQYILFI